MKIQKTFTFEAAHTIPGHPRCGRLHGHSYVVTVVMQGAVHPVTGMVLDFADLKREVSPIISRLDHTFLNWFLRLSTAENLAIYFARELAGTLGTDLTVRVNETAKTEAVFQGPADFRELETQDGWKEPFDKFVVFKDRKAMLHWVHHMRHLLEKSYQTMTTIGAKLAAFEMYKASLDEHEAAKLLSELQSYQMVLENEPINLNAVLETEE